LRLRPRNNESRILFPYYSRLGGCAKVAGSFVFQTQRGPRMKRSLIHAAMAIALALAVAAPPSLAKQTRAHRAALKLCKEKYKEAIRGSKYLKGHDRRVRRAQARRDREQCERMAPR